MEFAKFTGKTLDEALAAACNAKGCTKEELHYEVTEEKSGFLGIGKTIEIEAYCPKDIEDFIRDPEHIAVLIDYKIPSKYTESMPANLRFFDFSHASTGIGWAIDTVNAIGLNGKVRLYYDQNRFSMPHHTREMLVAAGMAGVDVTVTVQKFDQIDEGDITWLTTMCYSYIISKHRPPRPATDEEVEVKYREAPESNQANNSKENYEWLKTRFQKTV